MADCHEKWQSEKLTETNFWDINAKGQGKFTYKPKYGLVIFWRKDKLDKHSLSMRFQRLIFTAASRDVPYDIPPGAEDVRLPSELLVLCAVLDTHQLH